LIANLRLSLPPIKKSKANQTTLEAYKHAVIGLFKPLGKRVPGKQLDSRDWVDGEISSISGLARASGHPAATEC
jgi:hypothetical protein